MRNHLYLNFQNPSNQFTDFWLKAPSWRATDLSKEVVLRARVVGCAHTHTHQKPYTIAEKQNSFLKSNILIFIVPYFW